MNGDEGTDPDAQAVSSAADADDEPATDAGRDGEASEGAVNGDEEESTEGESGSSEDVAALLDRLAEVDEELAGNVANIVEHAREAHGTIADQREELADLADRIESQAETIDELRSAVAEREERIEEQAETIDEYESRVEDLEGRLKRNQADFQNYKKRAKKRQEQLQERATEDLVERLLGVRDNLKRALEEESGDAEALREGVEMTLREFDRVLEEENVEEVAPEPGSAVDPQRHEVMVQVDSEQPEGTIADVFTPGYEMAGKVIQSAQVTVSNGELADDGANGEGSPGERESDDGPDDADGEASEAEEAIELGGVEADDGTDESADEEADAAQDDEVSEVGESSRETGESSEGTELDDGDERADGSTPTDGGAANETTDEGR